MTCTAELFPLEPPRDTVSLVVREAWAQDIAVPPALVPYCPSLPVQGPRPARCVRDGGHAHHWDGRGTWWR